MDAVGLAVDGVALALPGVPGGAGLGLNALRYGDEAAQVTGKVAQLAMGKTDNVVDLGSTLKKLPGCPLKCFAAGTLVMVVDGEANIEAVEANDEVLAYDPEAVGDWVSLEPEPGPDPTACDPETDPTCKTAAVPVGSGTADEEVADDQD